MFKLPQLQPGLTGAHEGRSKSARALGSAYSAFPTASRTLREAGNLAGGIEVKCWEYQAREITAEIAASDKYKSIALHAEVKLAEALEKCDRVSPTVLTKDGEERPNRLRTAVCCQLLGEFAELCGPFAAVLSNLRDHLLKSVYSGYYVSERGLLSFDQLTWFSVAERLEKEKEIMLEEREVFKKQISDQGLILSRIEEQMIAYQSAMQSAQLEAATMKSDLEALARGREMALREAKTGREELKKARKEWLKMRDELDAEKKEHNNLKELHEYQNASHKQYIADSQAAVNQMNKKLQDLQRELDSSVPFTAIQGTKTQLENTMQSLAKERARVDELERMVSMLKDHAGGLTPRPNWSHFRLHGIQNTEGQRTQAVLSMVLERLEACVLRSELEELQLKLEDQVQATKMLEHVLVPDPLPKMIQLSVVTDSSAYFLTEASDDHGHHNSETEPGPSLAAEGLGVGPDIPRCLRWPAKQMVTMRPLSLQATEALIIDIWQAKEEYELGGMQQHLVSFLYHYFAFLSPAASQDHKIIAQSAYGLFHACSSHTFASTTVRMFSGILTGQLADAAWSDRQIMLRGFQQVLSSLPAQPSSSKPSTGPKVTDQDIREAIQAYFPARGSWQVHKLKETVSSEFTHEGDLVPLDEVLHAVDIAKSPPVADNAAHSSGQDSQGTVFVKLLLSQHLEELEAFGEEVAGIIRSETSKLEGAESSVKLNEISVALQNVMSKADVGVCLEKLTGYSSQEQDLIEDPIMISLEEAQRLPLVLRALCLLKPVRNYDLPAALSRVEQLKHTSEHGALSTGALPSVA
ncbi:hypothetical protein CEUSTIGMA_g1678.t1 [Chlamydomonas eustigma]|uniref:Translin-associated factor X-interacting protein 1 N-terminal domain-containing protein n=1 Tax=Chlamydomonas eustigma TaxID=1157962 RepID=A0A250WU20_9CHLO|nr:hypothetical protein CEUSTIGMA_g1678.t1 [Chlamydomonas eustigma]|eukprot:GAX74229.1 hypothetical protein CEUSTIGMA_g1678.t1 [Chlamydomonas eustigma]